MPTWYLYMVRCNDDSLYTGIATDVERRIAEHEQGTGAKYLRGKGPLQQVAYFRAGSHSRALRLEYRVKRLTKAEKERIVAEQRLPSLPVAKAKKGKRPKAASLPQPLEAPVTRKSQ